MDKFLERKIDWWSDIEDDDGDDGDYDIESMSFNLFI